MARRFWTCPKGCGGRWERSLVKWALAAGLLALSRDRALEERVQAEVTDRCGPNHALGGYRDDLRHLRCRIATLKDQLERAYALEDAYVNIIADAEGERHGA